MHTDDRSATVILHVAVDGCDGWGGKLAEPDAAGTDGPLATLAAARDRLRAMRAAGKLRGPAEVLVHAGCYRLAEPLRFGPADLGDERTPVTYRAAGDGAVHLTGCGRLEGFVPHEGAVLKLDLRAAGHAGLRFRQLFCDGVRQPLARYPNADPANPYGGGWLYAEGEPPASIYESGHGHTDRFICHDPRLQGWANITEIELFVFPRYNWKNDIIRLRGYDPASGEVVLRTPASYEIYPGDRFYFRNIREELDAPGEWYRDATADVLYFHPPHPLDERAGPGVVEAPHLENVIVVDGTSSAREDRDPGHTDLRTDREPELRPLQDPATVTAGYITFRGFIIEGCDGDGVVLRNCRACRLEGCTVRNTGAVGVIVLGGAACRVSDCDVSATGAHGLVLSGGERHPFRGRYLPCGHEARNNYIHHVGAFTKSVAGIAISGVGITVSHNLIHDGPRWGISSKGNDNHIEYNRIRHVNLETTDTAAIYTCDRDFTMRGTAIRYNHIHDILGYDRVGGAWCSPAFAFGIYLDDWTSGVEVRGNLTYRTPRGGMYIHAGQDNVVENNCFLGGTEEGAFFRRWQAEKELRQCGTHDQGLRRNLFRRNIVACWNAATPLYRFDNAAGAAGDLDVVTNVWRQNLLWHAGQPVRIAQRGTDRGHHGGWTEFPWEEWRARGFDADSLIADPRFVDAAADDFRLGDDSPAFALGFEPLPIDEMGLYRSEQRAATTWPIVEADGAREHPLV